MAHIHLTKEQQAELLKDSLGEKLKVVSDNLPSRGVTLAEVRDLIGPDGLLLLAALLALVFLVPVSIPGLSIVFGLVIMLVGLCRLRGRNLWLPKRIARRAVPADKLRTVLSQGGIWLHRLERVSRPHRLKRLASAGLMDILNNGALVTGGLLLMAPFVLVPFTNTLPGVAVLLIVIGLLQRDGLCILFGHLVNLLTIVYFILLTVGGSVAVHEAFGHILGRVK